MDAVKIVNLEKKFKQGQKVFSGLNLELEAGSMTALIGASGEGKTTLLNVIGLLDTDYQGDVEVAGQQVSRLSQAQMAQVRNQQIGFILQEPLLIQKMSVKDNILLPVVYLAKEKRQSKDYYLDRLNRLAEKLGVSDLLDMRPNTLSGGQKQRVTAIRALINDPQLILADEPTGSLDEENAKIIVDLLHDLHQEGKTILTVTHDMRVAKEHEQILRLKEGRVYQTEE